MRLRRRQMTWLLTANLIVLGVVFLLANELDMERDKEKEALNHHWKHTRNNFVTYNTDVNKRVEILKQQHLQLDAIAGFDFIHKENVKVNPTREIKYNVRGPVDHIHKEDVKVNPIRGMKNNVRGPVDFIHKEDVKVNPIREIKYNVRGPVDFIHKEDVKVNPIRGMKYNVKGPVEFIHKEDVKVNPIREIKYNVRTTVDFIHKEDVKVNPIREIKYNVKGPVEFIHKEDVKVNPIRDIRFNVSGPLDFIPPVPAVSDSDIVPSLTKRLTSKYLALPDITYTQKVIILTPVRDVVGFLERFAKLLANLSYPHELMTVYFGEDSSTDRTFDIATLISDDLIAKHRFKHAAAYKFNISGGVRGSWGEVHERKSQLKRRSHLARARNMLLNVGLQGGEFDYVLWIDSDVIELPRDLVQQLLFAKGDVVAPSCLYKQDGYRRVFDKNTWRETPTSLKYQKRLPKDALIVEGYTHSSRIYLSHLRAEGRVVPLDGVGGCSLLIKTECHRKGLNFPETVYRNHIETEGLAKKAEDMGFSVVGMPFVEVFH